MRGEEEVMKYPWNELSETQKIKVIQQEMSLVTHMGTTKDELLNMLRWLWDKFEIEECNTNCHECSGVAGMELPLSLGVQKANFCPICGRKF